MIAEAGAAISCIKVAIDMAKGISSLKSEAEINQAIIDIQRALLDAQNAALDDKQKVSSLLDQISDLRKQLQGTQNWENEKHRYVLTKSKIGAFTYDLKSDFIVDEIPHRLCVTCFQDQIKSILHTIASAHGGELVECNKCKSRLTLSEFGSYQTRPDSDY